MKTLLKALPIVLLSSLAGHSAQAEIEHETKKSIALVSSGIIGGILGGPVGFIVAGVGGALVVDAVFDENSLPEKATPQAIAQQVAPEAMTTESLTDDPFADDPFGDDGGADMFEDETGDNDEADEDSSWKIRKAAADTIKSLVVSKPTLLKKLYLKCCENLAERFSERIGST